jgi:hypothetical protein
MPSDLASKLEGGIQLRSSPSHSDDEDDETPFLGTAPLRVRKLRQAWAWLPLHAFSTCTLAVTVVLLVGYIITIRQNHVSVLRTFEYVPVHSDASLFNDTKVPLPESIATNLAMDAAICEALFPDLYESVDSAVEWFQNRGGISKEEYEAMARGIGHGRSQVIIRNNRLYVSACECFPLGKFS